MKKYTYLKDEEELTLIFEEHTDVNGNIIYSKDYQADPIAEKKLTYNTSGFLTEETEIAEEVELSRTEFRYDEQGRNTQRTLIIGGELYETLITTYNETGYDVITIREDVEVERLVKTVNGKDYTNRFYENGELVETQFCESDTFENRLKTTTYGSHNDLLGVKIETFDDSGMLLKSEEYNAENGLIKEFHAEIQNGLVLKEVFGEYTNGIFELENIYEYNENKNLVKSEMRKLPGELLGFHFYKYDDNNRLIEENGLSNGNYDTIYASYINGSEFHFVHIYEE